MRLLFVSVYPLSSLGRILLRNLRRSGVHVTFTRRFSDISSSREYDLILVAGLDRDVLKAFHHIDSDTPVLGVNTSGTEGFLASIGMEEMGKRINELIEGRYNVESYPRLKTVVDGTVTPPALNEVAVFPYRSAVLMEYSLEINGENIWRDYADGVIIATPMGSTAYAFSVGGPVIHPKAPVYEVVPVNSVDPARRPMVVSLDSKVKVHEINSKYPCEAVIDGVYRVKVEDRVEISLDGFANIAKFRDLSRVSERIDKKIDISKELRKLPPSAKFVLKVLRDEGPLTLRGITVKTMLPTRTVQRALAILMKNGLVRRVPNIRDMRQDLYVVTKR